jgi:hypothetical protein
VSTATPLAVVALLGCELEHTGTNNGVGASEGSVPHSAGGTGGTGQGGAEGNGLAICGNGSIDLGEVCDIGGGDRPPRNLCVDCQLDSIMLYSVAGTATPPSYLDGEGRLHLYYLATFHTFDDAAASCGITGAHLASILNDTEVSVATDLLGSSAGWVGAQDFGTPQWTTGEPWGYLPPGGYVTDGPTDPCILFDPLRQELRDQACTEPLQGVCEWVAPGTP